MKSGRKASQYITMYHCDMGFKFISRLIHLSTLHICIWWTFDIYIYIRWLIYIYIYRVNPAGFFLQKRVVLFGPRKIAVIFTGQKNPPMTTSQKFGRASILASWGPFCWTEVGRKNYACILPIRKGRFPFTTFSGGEMLVSGSVNCALCTRVFYIPGGSPDLWTINSINPAMLWLALRTHLLPKASTTEVQLCKRRFWWLIDVCFFGVASLFPWQMPLNLTRISSNEILYMPFCWFCCVLGVVFGRLKGTGTAPTKVGDVCQGSGGGKTSPNTWGSLTFHGSLVVW